MYKCLYNLELLILGTAKTPFQDYDEPIRPETPANYVRQLKNTDVDAIMLCPTAWKLPLWNSEVIPHWRDEAPNIKQPYFTADLKYHEKAYFRLRDYMLAGNDPMDAAVAAARECGIAPFVSYRMNDHHWLDQVNAFVHPAFWRNNPHLWISETNHHFNYMHEEVRDHYFALLCELVNRYDVDGVELDFMRSPVYFPEGHVQAGREIMTKFVRRIRTMMDKAGQTRGKKLSLCVRVPYTVEWCRRIGLEVGEWDREGLIDMVNVSTYFISSPEIDVDGYLQWVKNSRLYGEMHFIIEAGSMPGGFTNNINRKTTKEMYRALAAAYLDRGMHGVSFFNTDYARHHYFNEPRRMYIKDGEPPLEAFKGITDLADLRTRDKHYFVGPHYSVLPVTNNLQLNMYLADENISDNFRHAILRLKTRIFCRGADLRVKINGHELEEIVWTGELFPPLSYEALPAPENVRYYRVPTEILRHGSNAVSAVNVSFDKSYKRTVFEMVELALYRNNSFLENS